LNVSTSRFDVAAFSSSTATSLSHVDRRLVAEHNRSITLELLKYRLEPVGPRISRAGLTWCVRDRESSTQKSFLVERLLIVKSDLLGFPKERVGPQYITGSRLTGTLDGRRVGRRANDRSISGGRRVALVAFVPHQDNPAIRLQDAVELAKSCDRLKPVKGLCRQNRVGNFRLQTGGFRTTFSVGYAGLI